jgi:Flp pilus assembly protein TadD
MVHTRASVGRLLLFCSAWLIVCSPAHAAEPHWIRLNSSHFSVVADGGEKQGKEVMARFEQMRSAFGQLLMRSRVNLPEPMDVIALANQEDYSAVVPGRQGPLLSEAFFVPGEDRYYFVVNLSRQDSWRAVAYDFAKTLLNYNYPPAQPWFDEGFAQYFSSLQLGQKVQIGGEPESAADRSSSFASLLSSKPWTTSGQLFAMRPQARGNTPAPQDGLFAAQSWILLHFLINQNKLEQTGNYFDLALNRKLSAEQAIQQAYDMTPAQFDQAVRSYWQSLMPRLQSPTAAGKELAGSPLGQAPTVSPNEEIGSSVQELPPAVGQALVAEMAMRLPEHHDHAINQLNSLANQPKLDNEVAHRALSFAYLQNNQYTEATEELSKAAELDPRDPWIHFYAALIKYHQGQSVGREFEGLANMMQDLHAVLDWNSEFAECYNMLGLARVEGGGMTSAMQSMRTAMQLSPRNQQYELNMAKIYIAAKKFEAAQAMLVRLTSSSDTKIAQLASKQLSDLPAMQKYGVPPQPDAAAAPATSSVKTVTPSSTSASMWPSRNPITRGTTQPAETTPSSSDEDSDVPPQPQIDKRPLLYLKGRLISVDCSHAPMAIVTVSATAKRMNLRTEDYKSLTLIGADEFSCAWSNRPASVNYRAGGKSDGDLVSLEVY